jgi:PAS domain S-box-containing protein/diguanylate cyclase (GGDEF)-like protein
MTPAGLAGVVAALAMAAVAVASLWRASRQQAGRARRGYRWLAGTAVLVWGNLLASQVATYPVGAAAPVLSFADLPALLVLPALAVGLVSLGPAAGAAAGRPPRGGRVSRLCDGYLLAAALFLVGWVTLFGRVFASSGDSPAAFAAELVHPLADLVFAGALLGAAGAAGRRGLLPYLALVAVTSADALAVGARVSGDYPGVAALAVGLAALALLALAPVVRWPGQRAAGADRPARGVAAGGRASREVAAGGRASREVAAGGRASREVAAGGRASREVAAGGPAAPVATAAVAGVAAGVAALVVMVQAAVLGRMPEPVVWFVTGAMVVVLGARLAGLARRAEATAHGWREAGLRFRQLADRTSDVVLLCDHDGRVTYASRAVASYGYPPESLPGTSLAALIHPEDRAESTRAARQALAGGAQQAGHCSCRVRASDGTWRHVEATVSRFREPGGPSQLLITARDVSAQVELRRQVTHLTLHDPVTGLPNRAYIEDRSGHALAPAAGPGAASTAGVILIGVAGTAGASDAIGPGAFDLLRVQVARRLRLAVSPQDTVARWGQDEFAVLLEGTTQPGEVTGAARRLVQEVAAEPYQVGDAQLSLTACAGVAFAGGRPAAEVWRDAEDALAQARRAGGGQVEVFRSPPGEPAPQPDVSHRETDVFSG